MAEDRNDAVMKTLHFDGEDETKWDTWRFKMLAYAGKKGHKEAFLTDYKFGEDKEKWSDKEKANKVLMEAAWSQIALMVQGHALKSVMKVRSENPKEAWDKLTEEFEPKEITDVADLNCEFSNIKLGEIKENPIEWIELLEYNNDRVGAIEPKYLRDDFLMIAHIFAMLPKRQYETFISAEKKTIKDLTMRQMKKNILAHWKAFVKEDEKDGEAFYGEGRPFVAKKTGYKKPWNNRKFKGDCRKCGKQGHKAADCRGEAVNTGDTNQNKHVTCFKCQKKGHYARQCPERSNPQESGFFCGMVVTEAVEEIVFKAKVVVFEEKIVFEEEQIVFEDEKIVFESENCF